MITIRFNAIPEDSAIFPGCSSVEFKRAHDTFFYRLFTEEEVNSRTPCAAIKQAFQKLWKENEALRANFKHLAELDIVLNRLLWHHYNRKDYALSSVYNALWNYVDHFAKTHLKKYKFAFFLEVID